MIRLAMFLTLLPAIAAAGPWLREEGSTYLSFSSEFAEYDELEAWLSVYAEHGIAPGLTLGLDAGGRHTGTAGKAFAFARLPIIGDGNVRAAVQIGAGVWLDEDEVDPELRPGLLLGRGLDILEGGWIAADAFANVDGDGGVKFDLDGIVGLRVTADDTALLGLRGSDDGWRLVPGYERRIGPAQVAIQAVLDPEGDAPFGLALRTAFEF